MHLDKQNAPGASRCYALAMLYIGAYLEEQYYFSLPLFYTALCAGAAATLFLCAQILRPSKKCRIGLLIFHLALLLILPLFPFIEVIGGPP